MKCRLLMLVRAHYSSPLSEWSLLLFLTRLRIRVGRTEVLRHDERIAVAGIFDAHAFLGGVGGDKEFVLGHLAQANHRRRRYAVLANCAAPLRDDHAVG